MGPVETRLRIAVEDFAPVNQAVGFILRYDDTWRVIMGACVSLTGTQLSVHDMVQRGILADVFTEAIEAAEALEL